MDMEYEPLAEAFAFALQDYKTKKQISEQRTIDTDDPSKQLKGILLGVRRMLPQLFGGEEGVLAEFGLASPLSKDEDLMLIAARQCRDYWDSLCAPDPPPEYEPIAFLMDTVAGAVTELEDARLAAGAASHAKDVAQNTKDIAYRAAIDKISEIFNWYRGLYVEPEDERWQATPFGATYGLPGEPGEPEEPEEPEEFYGMATFIAPGTWDLWCSRPSGVHNARLQLQILPDGPIETVTELMLIEEDVFLPHRLFDMAPGDYCAYFTPLDEAGTPAGDKVQVEFTVEAY